uniref:Uncharacterized protein n=1 Tax=Arion vulgaris TaxID=1028688 RepID=A0A0B7BFI3_9EUPU
MYTYKDTLKVKCFDIDIMGWESLAQDRQMWHRNNTRGTCIAENRCDVEA